MALIRNLFLFNLLLVLSLCFALNSYSQELVVNGGFEDGGLDGWTTASNTNAPVEIECGFFRYSGTSSFNGNSIQAPPQGTHAVSSDTLEPPCSSAISQEITVPSGQKVSCSLIYYYENLADEFINGPGLNSSGSDNQQARIDILTENAGSFATGDGVLKNLFQTQPGDPLTLDYTTLDFDLTDYAGSTVQIRAAQANNQGVILLAIDAVSCTVEDELGDEISSVPTLSEWGLIAMAGILGIVGFIVMRRRKATA